MNGSRRTSSVVGNGVATGLLWISPWVVGFAVFMLVPIVMAAYFSLCEFDGLRRPVYIGFDNFRTMLSDPTFWKVLKNTTIYAAFSLPLGAVLAILFAIALNAPIPGRTLWRALIFVPTLVPMVATAMIWMWVFNADYGLLNAVLSWPCSLFGCRPPSWLQDAHWTMPAMIILSLWPIGHPVVIYLAGLQDVPTVLYEAARIDGANAWQRLWNVTLPLISPTIFYNIVMGIIFVWQVFAIPQIMLRGGGPQQNVYFFSMYLYDVAFTFQRFGYACTLSWVQLLIILSFTAFAFQLSRRVVHYQGGTP
ncbi:MAG: sugar ABC transporter permease [Phycisphaerae bacterium]|nr:sugar ABC transporter permease [Phycisphaerae bacterium]